MQDDPNQPNNQETPKTGMFKVHKNQCGRSSQQSKLLLNLNRKSVCMYVCIYIYIHFIFLLQLIFNIILYQFQVYSIVVRQLYNLQSDPPDISSTHLAPCIVITTLLIIFSMLYFTPLYLFCNYQFVLLNPFAFSPSPTTFLSSSSHQSVLCIYESVSVLFACLFCSLDFTRK